MGGKQRGSQERSLKGSLEQQERVTELLSGPLACLWTPPPMLILLDLTANPVPVQRPRIRMLRRAEQ